MSSAFGLFGVFILHFKLDKLVYASEAPLGDLAHFGLDIWNREDYWLNSSLSCPFQSSPKGSV